MENLSDTLRTVQAIELIEGRGIWDGFRYKIWAEQFQEAMKFIRWQTALVRQRKRPGHGGDSMFAWFRKPDGTSATWEFRHEDGFVFCDATPNTEPPFRRPVFPELVAGIRKYGPQKPVRPPSKIVFGDSPIRLLAERYGVNPSFKI